MLLKFLLMNEKDLLTLIDSYYNNSKDVLDVIYDYCIYKGKNDSDVQKLIIALLHNPVYIKTLALEAIETIIKENNIILIHDSSGNYLTSFIN